MLLAKDQEHILKHSKGLWEELRGKSVFITGGTGFFGKWLLESFVLANEKFNLNAKVVVLSRNPNAFRRKFPHFNASLSIEYHQGDVRNFGFVRSKFDYIIHAATDADEKLNIENPLLMLDTIIGGTRRTLEFAKHCGAKRFLLISSGAIYGEQPSELSHIPEEYSSSPNLIHPASAYGEAKRHSELLCSIYQKQFGLETIIARPFAFVGPYLNLNIHFAIGNFIRDGLSGNVIHVLGDGTPYRSYLYAADLAIWLWTILVRGKIGRIYNVGSDKEISIANVAKQVGSCFSRQFEVIVHQSPIPETLAKRYVPSIDRAKKELELQCWIDLEEALQRTIEFHRTYWEL